MSVNHVSTYSVGYSRNGSIPVIVSWQCREELQRGARWEARFSPFPHVVASNVLRDGFYQLLVESHRRHLQRGLCESTDTTRLSRAITGYDAYSLGFAALGQDDPLRFFVSRPWHDLLAAIAGVEATGDVNAALHTHSPNSRAGTPHNDLNPAFFVDNPSADGINISDNLLCDYCSGASHRADVRRMLRAASMIFYLNNEAWQPGDGGETGLYKSPHDQVSSPTVALPPESNSLVFFECTPFSYHSFMANCVWRHSVVVWLHRAPTVAENRWGPTSIVEWPLVMSKSARS